MWHEARVRQYRAFRLSVVLVAHEAQARAVQLSPPLIDRQAIALMAGRSLSRATSLTRFGRPATRAGADPAAQMKGTADCRQACLTSSRSDFWNVLSSTKRTLCSCMCGWLVCSGQAEKYLSSPPCMANWQRMFSKASPGVGLVISDAPAPAHPVQWLAARWLRGETSWDLS